MTPTIMRLMASTMDPMIEIDAIRDILNSHSMQVDSYDVITSRTSKTDCISTKRTNIQYILFPTESQTLSLYL